MRGFILLMILLGVLACNKNEKLAPGAEQIFYTLPQGNAPIDDTIVAFYDKYKSYVLYEFSQGDYSFNYTSELPDSAFNANPGYVDTALQFLKKQLIAYYPEDFLMKTMPFKILLASYIGSDTNRSRTGFASTNSMLAIGWADSTIMGKTPAEAKLMRSRLHKYYMQRAYRTASIAIPPKFPVMTGQEYFNLSYNTVSQTTRLNNGLISDLPLYTNKTIDAAEDFLSFIELAVGNTTAELEDGIFKPEIDVSSKIRKKYDVVVEYFLNEHGIDLKAIGQLP